MMLERLDGFLARLGLKREAGRRSFALDTDLQAELVTLAGQENRPEEEVQAELLARGLAHRHADRTLQGRWESLSRREQDVAALSCLGYTNRQIGARLGVSPDTVKGYVRQVLMKFQYHSKDELRMVLRDWDFSDWGPEAE